MDIETTLNKCDFGEAIGDEFHKLSYTRIQNMENLRDHSEDVQETLLMRAGIQHQPDKANMTICTHHSKKFDLARDAARDVANTSFEQLAVSPLKTHSLSKQR